MIVTDCMDISNELATRGSVPSSVEGEKRSNRFDSPELGEGGGVVMEISVNCIKWCVHSAFRTSV